LETELGNTLKGKERQRENPKLGGETHPFIDLDPCDKNLEGGFI
jgi:hypothetical protein